MVGENQSPISRKIIDNYEFIDGIMAYKNADGFWGFLSDNGQIFIDPQYTHVSSFEHGIAYVEYEEKGKTIRTYIDENNNPILSKRYNAMLSTYGGRYGLAYKDNLFSENRSYYLVFKNKILSKIEDKITMIHNDFVYLQNGNIYRITYPGGLTFVHCNKPENGIVNHIDYFELNKLDNKYYAVVECYLDLYGRECLTIMNIDGDSIRSIPTTSLTHVYDLKRINDKYFFEKTNSSNIVVIKDGKSFVRNPVLKENSGLFSHVFCDAGDLGNDFIWCKYDTISFIIGNPLKNIWSDVYNKIWSKRDEDYFVTSIGLDKYFYLDKETLEVKHTSNDRIFFYNGIGISRKTKVCNDSNSEYKYYEYRIYDKDFNIVRTIPNDINNIKLKINFTLLDNVLVSESLLNNKLYLINTNNLNEYACVPCDSYSIINGLIVVKYGETYKIIGTDGSVLYDNLESVEDVGENKLLITYVDKELFFKGINPKYEIVETINSNDLKMKVTIMEFKNNNYESYSKTNELCTLYNYSNNTIEINNADLDEFLKLLDNKSDYLVLPINNPNVKELKHRMMTSKSYVIKKDDLINRIGFQIEINDSFNKSDLYPYLNNREITLNGKYSKYFDLSGIYVNDNYEETTNDNKMVLRR